MQNKADYQVNAGFAVRLVAYIVDSVIVALASFVVRIPFWISSWISPDNLVVRDLIFSYSIADIIIYLLSAIYFIALTYKSGATIGKRLFHLKVVSTEDRKPTLFEVIYRETIGRFLAGVIGNVGYLLVAVQEQKRGWHDMLSDTQVVYCHNKVVMVETPVEVKEVPQMYTPYIYGEPVVQCPKVPEIKEENVMEQTETTEEVVEIEENNENENSI